MDTGERHVANEWLIPYDQNGDGIVEDAWFNLVYHPMRESDGTIRLELVGIKAPEMVNGIRQTPLEGQSLVYTFDNPDAPSRHSVRQPLANMLRQALT
jgi:hypothetical protein